MRPIADDHSKVLILGSFPGEISLVKRQYYGNDLNQFWSILFAIFRSTDPIEYSKRTAALLKAKNALWDVIRECKRAGSSDGAIQMESVRYNDVYRFLRNFDQIRKICFNGKQAYHHFLLSIGRNGKVLDPGIRIFVLPSTSTANARMRVGEKLVKWMKPFESRL